MKPIPEFETILSKKVDVTSASYCMLYSFHVDLKNEPVNRTVENDGSQKRNQLVGQFNRRYSNTLNFSHWSQANDGS